MKVNFIFVCMCIAVFASCSGQDSMNSPEPGEAPEASVVDLTNDSASQGITLKAQRFGTVLPFHGQSRPYYEPNGITFSLSSGESADDVPKFSFSVNLSEKTEQAPLLQPIAGKNFENDDISVTVVEKDRTACREVASAATVAADGATCAINKRDASVYVDKSEWSIPDHCSKGCGDTNEKIGHLSGTLKFNIQYTHKDKGGTTSIKEFKYDGPFDLDLMNCPLFCVCSGAGC